MIQLLFYLQDWSYIKIPLRACRQIIDVLHKNRDFIKEKIEKETVYFEIFFYYLNFWFIWNKINIRSLKWYSCVNSLIE